MIVSEFDWPTRRAPKILWVVWLLLGSIIISIFVVFYVFFLKPSFDSIGQMHKDIQLRQKTLDSLSYQTEKVLDDTLISEDIKLRYVGNKILFLEDQYANVINDIRQETNNHIEYVNAWQGIWVAIMALVCGVAPALLQYRLYIINRRKLREELELYEQILGSHEIGNYANSVMQCLDAQITSDSTISRKLIGILLHRLTNSLEKLHYVVLAGGDNRVIAPSQRNAMALSLIQMSGVLDRIKARVNNNNIRRLNDITNKISQTVGFLVGLAGNEAATNIVANINAILNELKSLSLEWDFIDDS